MLSLVEEKGKAIGRAKAAGAMAGNTTSTKAVADTAAAACTSAAAHARTTAATAIRLEDWEP